MRHGYNRGLAVYDQVRNSDSVSIAAQLHGGGERHILAALGRRKRDRRAHRGSTFEGKHQWAVCPTGLEIKSIELDRLSFPSKKIIQNGGGKIARRAVERAGRRPIDTAISLDRPRAALPVERIKTPDVMIGLRRRSSERKTRTVCQRQNSLPVLRHRQRTQGQIDAITRRREFSLERERRSCGRNQN